MKNEENFKMFLTLFQKSCKSSLHWTSYFTKPPKLLDFELCRRGLLKVIIMQQLKNITNLCIMMLLIQVFKLSWKPSRSQVWSILYNGMTIFERNWRSGNCRWVCCGEENIRWRYKYYRIVLKENNFSKRKTIAHLRNRQRA